METTTSSKSTNAIEQQGYPHRRVIASFRSYREAQRTVDYLADCKFPVDQVAIIAEGLRFVEQITGRLSLGKAMLNGAVGGATLGLILGFLLGLFFIAAPFVTAVVFAVYGLVAGLVFGAFIGLISYILSGGERDFTSVGALQAGRYNVVVDVVVADEAIRLLERRSGTVTDNDLRNAD